MHRSVWTDLQDTRQLPHLAVRVFDGQLCILQRFLYGDRQPLALAQGRPFSGDLDGLYEAVVGAEVAQRLLAAR